MATQGRRGGSRRAAGTTSRAVAPEPPPALAPAAVPFEPEAELLDDVATAIGPRHLGGRLGRSLSGAVVGTLLVVGLAFGAAIGQTAWRDGSTAANDTTAAGHLGVDGDGDGADATDKPDVDGHDGTWPTDKRDGEHPDATPKPENPDATDKPDVEPTQKPHEPDPTPKPTEKPDPTKAPVDPISLALVIKELHPFMEWGSCEGFDFSYYKVVRSMDSTVTWPPSDGDEAIAVVEPGGARKAYDKYAPHGHKAWYRVFCVRKTEAGYKVLNASAAKGIEVPEEPTPPDPISLGIDWSINGEGKVVLTWDACEVDGFGFYKVVKSTWNENPSYLPWTDGTQVIGVVESMFATEWHDWAPDAGHTAWYRVQCLGYVGDMKVLLGQTALVTVTTPEP